VEPPSPAHPWMPSSPCGPRCVSTQAPTVWLPRRVVRLCAAIGVLLLAAALAPLLVVLPGRPAVWLTRRIFRSVVRTFGVHIRVHGDESFATAPSGRGALVVNNHVSWLDIVAVNAVRPMRALAKVEVGRWPIVGALTARAGTIFLERERLSGLPATIAELADALRSGSQVNVCPEGTTRCGLATGRFTRAIFQSAIDGGVPVRPIALRYRLSDGCTTTWPAFVGEETLIDSVRRVARLRGLTVDVYVCPEIAPGRAADRRELAALTESEICTVLYGTRSPVRPGAPCTPAPA